MIKLTQPPIISTGDQEKDLKRLTNYVYQLVTELQYVLDQLEARQNSQEDKKNG